MRPWLPVVLALALLAPGAAAVPGLPLLDAPRDCQLDCWVVQVVLGIAEQAPEPPLSPPGGVDPGAPSGPGGFAS